MVKTAAMGMDMQTVFMAAVNAAAQVANIWLWLILAPWISLTVVRKFLWETLQMIWGRPGAVTDELTSALRGTLQRMNIRLHGRDVPCEYLHSESDIGPGVDALEDVIVYITICGNPGNVRFYSDYVHTLQDLNRTQRLSAKAICYVCGFVGHSHTGAVSTPLGYKEQMEAVSLVVDNIVSRHPTQKIVISGHSIGTHAMLELLGSPYTQANGIFKPRNNSNILLAVCLYGCVDDMRGSPKGTLIYPLVKHLRHAVGSFNYLLSANLPVGLLRLIHRFERLLRWQAQTSPACEDAILSLILGGSEVVASSMKQASDCLEQVTDVTHLKIMRHLGSRLVFIDTPTDRWQAMGRRAQLKKRVERAQFIVAPDFVPHAYVLDKKSMAYTADIVLRRAAAALRAK